MKARKKQTRKIEASTRAEVFLQLLDVLGEPDWPELERIAEVAGVSPHTIYNWCYGPVLSPHLRTIVAVASAVGYDLVLKKKAPKLRVVK